MKTVLRGGRKTHLVVPAIGETRTACGLTVPRGDRGLSGRPKPTCSRCAPYWRAEGDEEATTGAREAFDPARPTFAPGSEAANRREMTQKKAGRILFKVNGLKGFAIASSEEVALGVGLAALEAGRDPREIAWGLESVTLR